MAIFLKHRGVKLSEYKTIYLWYDMFVSKDTPSRVTFFRFFKISRQNLCRDSLSKVCYCDGGKKKQMVMMMMSCYCGMMDL